MLCILEKDDCYTYGKYEQNVMLFGSITNGCLHLESCVYGEVYDSEKYYDFTAEDTRKLFSIIKFNDFIASCREGHLMWL